MTVWHIPKYLDGLDDDFVGQKQCVTALKEGGQNFSPGGTTGRMRADQDGRIKDNSHPTGL